MKADFDNKELDQLFKNKAQSDAEEPEFEEAAWADMERRLDKRKRRFLLYYLSAAALLFGTLSLGFLFFKADDNLIPKEKTYTVKPDATDVESSIPKATEKIISSEKEKAIVQTVDSKKSEINKVLTYQEDKPNENSNLDNKVALATVKQDLDFPMVKNSGNNEEGNWDNAARIEGIEIPITETTLLTAQIKPVLFTETKPIAEGKQDLKDEREKINPVWSLGFSAGQEINTLGNGSKSGNNLVSGIYLSSKFNKLSFALGANYGLKTYSASAIQYQNIKPQFINYISAINAACNILEVPLTVSYEVASYKKSALHLNLGLSSYFMLKEKYDYQYKPYSGYSDYSITRINRNQHYLKVIQLSGTYEVSLKNSQSALGLEPFMKLPLSGVGEGGVYLKSYGINLHFNYQFKKTK